MSALLSRMRPLVEYVEFTLKLDWLEMLPGTWLTSLMFMTSSRVDRHVPVGRGVLLVAHQRHLPSDVRRGVAHGVRRDRVHLDDPSPRRLEAVRCPDPGPVALRIGEPERHR